MYLIDVETLRLRYFVSECPPYAILSHTWGDDEVTFADFAGSDMENAKQKAGYRKIELTCDQAKADGIKYAWVDTCCINKDSSAELSEAINSMYAWYSKAALCYAYIEDVSFRVDGGSPDVPSLKNCRWFTRGWTLQELLAPSEVVFYGPDWIEFGRKTEICELLHDITGIPENILRKEKRLEDINVAARMSWAAERQTTRPEDLAYCLMGIFDINMPLLYGEGHKAFIRLQEQIMSQIQDDSLFAWCSTVESADQFPYRGLLASSPRDFQGCADLIHFGVGDTGTTRMLGNGNVSLRCSVSEEDDKTIFGLKCFRDNISKVLGIEVMKIGLNNYIRVNPSRLAECSLRSFDDDVVIEKYAMRVHDARVDNVHLRDAIYLGDLPEGVSLKAVHQAENFGPPRRTLSIFDTIHKKVAFELEISSKTSGTDTHHDYHSIAERLFLLFWVEPQSGSRSYSYYFDAFSSSHWDSQSQFAAANKPQDIYTMREVRIGWSVICVSASRRKVQGHDMLYLDTRIERNESIRNHMLSELAKATEAAEKKNKSIQNAGGRACGWSLLMILILPSIVVGAVYIGKRSRVAGIAVGVIFAVMFCGMGLIPIGRGNVSCIGTLCYEGDAV